MDYYLKENGCCYSKNFNNVKELKEYALNKNYNTISIGIETPYDSIDIIEKKKY